ncbi:hypothetical protein JCM14469_36450 [Desulfatiferula olefinivorans]
MAAVLAAIVLFSGDGRLPDWTLAVYLDGSDTLLLEQQRNFIELIEGRPAFPDGRVVVCLDRGPSPRVPMPGGWTGPRVFDINGSFTDTLSRGEPPGNLNTDGSRTGRMRAFFDLVHHRYGATRTAFIIVGHGQGWAPLEPGDQDPSGYNATEIAESLRGLKADVLGLDLCLMGDLESVYQLRHSADYLVVSQGMLPSRAQDYRILLKRLGETPPRTPRQMADLIHAASSGALKESRLSGAVSLIQTGPFLEAFVFELGEQLQEDPVNTALTSFDAEAFRLPDWGGTARQMVDLGGVLAAVSALKQERLSQGAFVLKVFSTHPRFSGLSVYWPTSEARHAPLRDAYRALDVTRDSGGRLLTLIESRLTPSP